MGFVETMISKGPTMCILPWMHIYTSAGGDVVPCCEAQESIMNAGNLRETWNGPKYKELRTALMRGEQHPACHVCHYPPLSCCTMIHSSVRMRIVMPIPSYSSENL